MYYYGPGVVGRIMRQSRGIGLLYHELFNWHLFCMRLSEKWLPLPPPPPTDTHAPTHHEILVREIAPDQIASAGELYRYPPNNFNTQPMKYISTKTLCEVTNCNLHLAITCLSLHSTCDQSVYSLGKYSEYSVLAGAISLLACIRDVAGLHLIGTKNTLPAGFPGFVQSLQTSGRP